MGRQKTSKADVISIRLNPIHPEQKKVMDIISEKTERGATLKDIFVTAMLRYGHYEPTTFLNDQALHEERLAKLLAEAVVAAIGDVRQRPALLADDDENGGEVSRYAQNLARGLLSRRQQALGDDD